MIREIAALWDKGYDSHNMSELNDIFKVKDNIFEINKNYSTWINAYGNRGYEFALVMMLGSLEGERVLSLFEKRSDINGIRLVGYLNWVNTDKYGNPITTRENLFKIRLMKETSKKINWDYWEDRQYPWFSNGDGGGNGWELTIDFWKKIADAQWYNPKYY